MEYATINQCMLIFFSLLTVNMKAMEFITDRTNNKANTIMTSSNLISIMTV
ncbi:protein of unknown function [Xenorhabdus poinarii G6]|uniref:Uncharacterized protein n=1 Tax=Xenorhabdus poinarii G6 TaxID=1354304 RepID=A0A068R2W4_9GAMM|nr:protein of unknown function [Xenorhabdus poinarii G6]